MAALGVDALTATAGEPSAWARHAVRAVFTSWPGSQLFDDPLQVGVLDRVLSHLAVVSPPPGDGALLNAQVSIDTARPEGLRLTIDPFAGAPLAAVARRRALAAVASLQSSPLQRCVEAVYRHRSGDALPHSLWLGFAPGANGHVAKAYLSSRGLHGAAVVAGAARAAGWLPDRLAAAVVRRYERLVPMFASVEGVGVAYRTNTRVGTTVYLRSLRPWSMCTSDGAARLIDIGTAALLGRVRAVFGGPPAVFGWSIECDDRGELVDVKLEVGASGWFSHDALRALGDDLDVDTSAVSELAAAIDHCGLGHGGRPTPAFTSLRFIGDRVSGIVVYFPLALPRPKVAVTATAGRRAACRDKPDGAGRIRYR